MSDSTETFPAFLVKQDPDGATQWEIAQVCQENLPPGDVLIRVAYSSLNYKDAMSASGHRGVTRKFPHVPGIDAAGHVESSTDARFRVGDAVIVTGHDMGMNTWGGFARYIRVPGEWVVSLPKGLLLRESMILGTAGFTAGLCVHALEQNGLKQESGEVVVTGATGGVGCLGVSLLAKLGYQVVASTGKTSRHDFLTSLGAAKIIAREEITGGGAGASKAMLKEQWAGAMDTVGGATLGGIVKSLRYGCAVASCGVVGGTDLPFSIYPFILRGVRLLGIASAECPRELRLEIWKKLASKWKLSNLELVAQTVTLDGLAERIRAILAGEITGRVVVEMK